MSDAADEMLSIAEVCRFFGGSAKPLGKSTVYRWVNAGRLPSPVRMGPQTQRWRRSDCQRLLDELAAKAAGAGGA